jgi:hypothetical protein
MSKYICPTCNKDFKQKINFINHTINKKIPCKIITEIMNNSKIPEINSEIPEINSNIPEINSEIPEINSNIPEINSNIPEINSNITENNYKITEINSNIPEINSEIPANIEKPINLICRFCNNTFSRKDYLNLHIKKYCKNKKHFEKLDDIKSKINININDEKYDLLLEKINTLTNVCNQYEKILKENNLLKNSIPCVTNNNNITNNNNNNTDNSTTNNSAINNGLVNNGSINTGNTINIVQFGKEDISKCNLIEMMGIYLKSTGGNIFSNMLKYLNFNPSYPENFNILMSDLARENVKIHNGKRFVTKKFKTVKNEILNVLNDHINNMCDIYIEDPKTKKNDDILSKIKINDISVKLINDDDITPLLKNKKNNIEKEIIYDSDGNEIEEESDDDSDIDDLDLEGKRKLTHYENKRLGLQELTIQKLKDELYNGRVVISNSYK